MPIERLGCATSYDVQLRFQGGDHQWTHVEGLTELVWSRKRDDYSEASFTVTKSLAGADCCGRLTQTRVWGHEMRILRDQRTVWEGPIIKKRQNRATLEFEGRDMLFWLDRRPLSPRGVAYHFHTVPVDTGRIIRQLITDGFPVDDAIRNPGLTEYADLRDSATGSTTDMLWKNSTTIGQVVRDLIGAGVDLYAVGRRIYAIPERDTSTPYQLTEAHFLDELEVVENGLDTCTQAVLVGGQPVNDQGQPIQDVPPVIGVRTIPNTAPPGQPKPLDFYGLVTRMSSSTNTTHQATADGIAGAMLAAGFPPPVDIIVPSGAKLSSEAPVDIGQLVPGRPFTVLLSESYCDGIQQRFRLNEMEATVDLSGDGPAEEIAVSLTSSGPAEGVPQGASL